MNAVVSTGVLLVLTACAPQADDTGADDTGTEQAPAVRSVDLSGATGFVLIRPTEARTVINGAGQAELFKVLENGDIDTYKDWKGRYKQNLDKMKTGRLSDVAEVLKNLRLVSQKKSLSFREKKMYERAKQFIVSEVAHVNEITVKEAERRVEKALESSLAKRVRAGEATASVG